MPIYEYKCNKCGEKFEAWVKLGQGNEVKCTKCGSENLEKLVSAFSSCSLAGSGAHERTT